MVICSACKRAVTVGERCFAFVFDSFLRVAARFKAVNVLDNLTQKAILMFETVHFRAKL